MTHCWHSAAFGLALILASGIGPRPACAQSNSGPTPAQDSGLEFFERRVRPVLVDRCQGCHGEKKQEAGLRLDSAAAVKAGGDSGPLLVSGDPDNSLLVEVIRYDGGTKMPPKGKLPDEAIAALTEWVKLGAPWPEEAAPTTQPGADKLAASRKHWAFQPVARPEPPAVSDRSWIRTPVDAFILARLDAAGLKPSPPADRRTLIRRVTFDLHGLPATPEEITAFESDASPTAWETVVNRLLDSPRYGERWGRYWLDVARYADSKGYVRLAENPMYPSSWTYRDYVIRSFNEDLPYDRFILEQIAADQLDLGDDPRPLAAMGFLTLGQRFINSQHDIIDDRIDVVTRGLMGLTVTCARCHDHKFDAIPTRDYYSLHGVFASSLEPRVPPLLLRDFERANYEPYLAELKTRTDALDAFLNGQRDYLMENFRARAGEYLLTGQSEEIQPNFLAIMFLIDANKDLNPVMTQRWARYLGETRKRHHPVLAPWNDLAKLKSIDASAVAELIPHWRSSTDPNRINQSVVDALAAAPPRDLTEAAAIYSKLFEQAEERWQAALQENPAATSIPEADWEEIRQLLYGPDSPIPFTVADLDDFLFVDATKQNVLHGQQKKIEDWVSSPGAAPHAMSLVDSAAPADSHVFLRGNASNLGEVAPRQFLSLFARGNAQPFEHGSGRLELAQAIASPDNPLTARVLVNRVWMNHFGAGLVHTPGDFGLRGDAPTHPQLLDHLASRFIDEGWSLKKLHRAILLSSTYQQVSSSDEAGHALDPENALLWRANRRRLDWEAFRDSLLAVSGELDVTTGGPSVNLFTEPFSKRRSVYGLIDRQNLPGTMRSFDFVPPEATSPQRHQTTVPQQALFLMNSPFLKERIQALSVRPELTAAANDADRITAAFRLIFGRPVEPDELALARQYLATASTQSTDPNFLTPWQEFLQTLLLSNEFVFVD